MKNDLPVRSWLWLYCSLFLHILLFVVDISFSYRTWHFHSSSLLGFLSTQQEDCEKAYFKMDNVLIDDRRIHVDFSQSVAKIKWKGIGTFRRSFLLCRFLSWHTKSWVNSLCFSLLGGKYTKDDFKAYEKDLDSRSKLALKDQMKPKQEYPCVLIGLHAMTSVRSI